MDKKDGGPAFPHTLDMVSGGNERGGMSLRDYLAGQALQACFTFQQVGRWENYAQAASDAYMMADAMLAEREK